MKAARRAGGLTYVDGESVALVADGDRVVHHSFSRMRHTGDAFGVAATGRELTFHSLEIWRVADGKIVEHWGGEREAERLYEQLVREGT
jgi:predicted ester cyclase